MNMVSKNNHRRTYDTWYDMMRRCYQEHRVNYKRYGGKGIKVCDRWHSFNLFKEDMGYKPPNTALGRKDHNKNYCKENCMWTKKKGRGK
jgi:hypothetical protein